MTFSIVARSLDGTELGVAVASKFLAVGAVVPAAAAGVGALATQAQANVGYRRHGLRLLRDGRSAADTVGLLTADDADRDSRQVGVVDRHGGSASFTGTTCHPWAGGEPGPDHAVQGNILTGPAVVGDMRAAFLDGDRQLPLARRLLAALQAGDDAGGDRRGRQSAALLVVRPGGGYGGGSDVAVDLRVDDHPDPVRQLARLLALHELYFGGPDRASLRRLSGELLVSVRELLRRVGQPVGDGGAEQVRAALRDWAGVQNLEERVGDATRLDPLVLEVLQRQAEGGPPVGDAG